MSELAKEAKKKLQQVSLILASCKTFFQYEFEIKMIKTFNYHFQISWLEKIDHK